jgi:hypothetical protein
MKGGTAPQRDDPALVDDVSAIDAAWLTAMLRATSVDAVVGHVSAAAVGTGQMGSCFRLTIRYTEGKGPERLVVKLPSTDPASRAAGAMGYRTEVCFYQRLAREVGIRTPKCWYAAVSDDSTSFTLVLEDLAPGVQGDQIAGCTAAQAQTAAANVARLHGRTWCRAELFELPWLIPPVASSASILGPFLQAATAAFVERYATRPADTEVLLAFAERFVSWAQGRQQPFSLVHSDYRLDNLLFFPPGSEDTVAAVDWQALTIGLPLRDLAFLLATGLDVEDRRTAERSLVDHYQQALAAGGVKEYSPAQCWEDYRYALFQAPLITVLGSYVARPTERGDRMFTVMAERACTAIRDLGALALI